MSQKPTENGEAYLAFIQGRNLRCNVEDFEKLKQAEQLFERAIELDPKFALAYAGNSDLQSWIYHNFDPVPARRERARALANRALELKPNLPEGHMALGTSHYYGDQDYEGALREFGLAKEGLPNQSEVYLAIGAIQRRQGHWEESTANLEKAASLSPNDPWPLQNLSFNYQMVRNYDAAIATLDRALKIVPKSISLLGLKAKFVLAQSGDLSGIEPMIQSVQNLPAGLEKTQITIEGLVFVRLMQRNYAEAARVAESIDDSVLKHYRARSTASM
jgi:tetratricopeptide (TPR) repeat protein